MKLVYINPQSYNNLSKYDVGYLSELGEWDRHYICSTLLDRDLPTNISIYKLFRYNKKTSNLTRACSYIRSLIQLLFVVQRISPTIMHVQWTKIPVVDYLFLRLARRLTNCKIVLTAHNVVPHNKTHRRHFWLGHVYSLADVILVHEPAAATAIKENFRVRNATIRVVRHGAISLENTGQIKFGSTIADFFATATLKMCFFGRGDKYKGIDVLLEAWSQLSKNSKSQAHLLVIGRLEDDIRKIVKESETELKNILIIDEFVSEADLYTAVTSSDVILFPYKEISQSGALLSVLDLGKPIIVSNRHGLTEPLEIGDIGWVFDGTAGSLSMLISGLIENPDLVNNRRDDSQAWLAINTHYSWIAIGPEIRAAYDGLHIV